MNKKSENFIATLVVAVSICSIIGNTPVYAAAKGNNGNYSGKVTTSDTYTFGTTTDKNGTMTQASSQALSRSNYLYGRLDNESESSIIEEFKACGLTEADYYALKTQRQADTNGKPTLGIGWVKNNHDKWFYSEDGKYWATSKWECLGGKWYFFDGSGAAVTGWNQLYKAWYYFDNNCQMVANQWVDGYWIGADGVWIK